MHPIIGSPGTRSLLSNPLRTRTPPADDVYTEFFDAGIGCCWFAQKGDGETATGDTEDEALERLACFRRCE